MERREYLRAEIEARCHVTGPSRLQLNGTVKNLSRGGLLMTLSRTGLRARTPDVGDVLKVDMELPANPVFGRKSLTAKGLVVRVNNTRDTLPLVALQILDMKFASKVERRPVLVPRAAHEVR